MYLDDWKIKIKTYWGKKKSKVNKFDTFLFIYFYFLLSFVIFKANHVAKQNEKLKFEINLCKTTTENKREEGWVYSC